MTTDQAPESDVIEFAFDLPEDGTPRLVDLPAGPEVLTATHDSHRRSVTVRGAGWHETIPFYAQALPPGRRPGGGYLIVGACDDGFGFQWRLAVAPAGEYWRVGRTLGRTLYVHRDGADLEGTAIGMVDTREYAELIVAAVNARLQLRDPGGVDRERD